MIDTLQKGEIAKLKVMLRAIEKGFIVSTPSIEGCRYDLVIDDGIKLWRTQCKYINGRASKGVGSVVLNLRRDSGFKKKGKYRTYTTQDIDVIVGYIPETGDIVWLPPELWQGKLSLQLRVTPTLSGQVKRIVPVSQYVW